MLSVILSLMILASQPAQVHSIVPPATLTQATSTNDVVLFQLTTQELVSLRSQSSDGRLAVHSVGGFTYLLTHNLLEAMEADQLYWVKFVTYSGGVRRVTLMAVGQDT